MSSFGGIRKVNGEWTDEEKEKIRASWKKAEAKCLQKMVANGYVLQNIAVPLPDVKNYKKYIRDSGVKKLLEPYQTINPLRVRKPVVD
jgi:hypothetical protein